MSIRSLVLLAALMTALAPRSAAAQGPAAPAAGATASPADIERARQLHQEGLAHYEKRQYGRAIAAYRKAYALVPAPGILFNLAQAYRLRGECKRAYRAYKNFLAVVTDTPEANLAREHANALRPCAKAPAEPEPAPPPAIAPAPELTPQLAETPAPPPPVAEPVVAVQRAPRPHRGQDKKILGLGIGGAGGVLALVGAFYGFKARGAASDLSDFYDEGGVWTDELSRREDDLDRHRALALGFGLTGAAAIGTGAVLYWLGHKESSIERADQGAVAVVPGSGGAVVTWSGAF